MSRKALSYEFDDVTIDLRRFEIWKAGEAIRIEPKAYEVLLYLIEHRAGVVEKSELLDTVWKDSFVTENALTRVIAQLRKALGDTKDAKYIATIHKRGYRFVADTDVTYEDVRRDLRATDRPPRELPRRRIVLAAMALVIVAMVTGATYFMSPGRAAERTANPRAYEAYLRGRFHANSRSIGELQRSVEYFETAISEDNDYAPAYAGLSDAYSLLGAAGFIPPGEAFPKAKRAASTALERGGESAEAYTALAAARMNYDWDWAEANREIDRAIDLDPRYPNAHVVRSQYLVWVGRLDEAVSEATLAHDLDPLGNTAAMNLGWTYYYARRYDEAIAVFGKVLELNPSFAPALYGLGESYEGKGMIAEAVETLERAKQTGGGYPSSSLAHALGRAGRRAEAEREIADLVALSEKQYVSPYYIAVAYLGLNDTDRTLEQLERACDERSGTLVSLRANPRFDRMRADPRFERLLARIGPR